MEVEKGVGKGKVIPQDDFGMWISDILKEQEAKLKQFNLEESTEKMNKEDENEKGNRIY